MDGVGVFDKRLFTKAGGGLDLSQSQLFNFCYRSSCTYPLHTATLPIHKQDPCIDLTLPLFLTQ